MSKDFNPYEPRTLVAALAQIQVPKRFLMKTFFHRMKCSPTKNVDVDVKKGGKDVGVLVHPLMDGNVVQRDSFETFSVEPGYTKEKIPLTASDVVERSFGEDYSVELDPATKAINQATQDIIQLEDRTLRLEEKMSAEALFTGKIHLKGKGMDRTVNFGYEVGRHINVLSGASAWNKKGDPMFDLDKWCREISERSGYKPNIIIIGKNVIPAVIDNELVQKRLDIRNFNLGTVGPITDYSEDGVTYYGRLMPSNVDIYSYDETYYNIVEGKYMPFVPDDAVFLGHTRAGCVMHYGLIQNMYSLRAVPRFPHHWTEQDGSASWLQLESAPLPNPYQIDAFMINHVLD